MNMNARMPDSRRGNLDKESVIRLSQENARKIISLLDHPPKPNKRLKDAVKAFKDSVRA
jgi:uncharacterized protein (DUF1778 family)